MSGRAAACAAPSTPTLIAGQLLDLRGIAPFQHGSDDDESYPDVVFDAMVVALSGRIFLDETVELPPRPCSGRSGRTTSSSNPAAAAPG